MAVTPRTPHPSAEQRRALEMLAGAGQNGCTDAFMMAHGFTIALLVELIHDGLASVTPQRVLAGGRMIEVARVRITDAGRQAVSN
jgi:hypothetical protein